MHRALLLAALLALAGCQAPGVPFGEGGGTATTGVGDQVEMGPTPSGPDGDPLGWEDGYWHNQSVDVNRSDGLNASEREAVIARAMARVEYVRGLEFETTVSVDVINRSTYGESQSSNHSEALQRFDNAKFQALFLVGEESDSIDVQEETRTASVLGYYSPSREAIVLVSEGDTPSLSGEAVLAHELVHALQDQHFDLGNSTAETRDAYQGRNGIVEGDASLVQRRYMARCGTAWACLDPASESSDGGEEGDGPDVHPGIQVLEYFPYSDGPGFVAAVRDRGGWAAVDEVYADKPDGATEVIDPGHYPEWEPASVGLADRTSADWERIRPPDRPDYGVMGQSAIVAAQAYTLTDDVNSSAVVRPRQVLNVTSEGTVDGDDPYRYDTPSAEGWAGGRFHAYERGDGELAYVWRTRWENADEAAEFAAGWADVIAHWGGERVGEDAWVIDGGEFADAYAVRTDGATVTVVNAPRRSALSAVHAG